MIEIEVLDLEQGSTIKPINTLVFHPDRCVNCGICLQVCPHRVFAPGERRVMMVNGADCMECGACQKNCPANAIKVDSGVGCASAMIMAALKGRDEVNCGEDCCR
ncbi:MAG TPA: mercury methylation ferredoxin HgcB [Methanomassiliicoccales archaeon]|nr:mercury methylation ferredoxin HgcB [Methanomassiliicoccales archaeon]